MEDLRILAIVTTTTMAPITVRMNTDMASQITGGSTAVVGMDMADPDIHRVEHLGHLHRSKTLHHATDMDVPQERNFLALRQGNAMDTAVPQ